MIHRKKYFIFLFLTLINIGIFVYRDHFAYHRVASYSSLYSAQTDKWKKFIDDFSKKELAEAANIIDSSVILKEKPTAEKIAAIGNFIYNQFNRQIGRPLISVQDPSPFSQYKIFSSNDTMKLWCGNLANMFAFFCWSKGIACRVVEIMNPGDHHVVNECYLPETKEWAMVDLTHNHLLFRNKNKEYFNLLDLREGISDNEVSILQSSDSGIISSVFSKDFYNKYFANNPSVHFYYRTNTWEVYKTTEKLKRYIFPITWYEEFNSGKKNNWLFYMKELFIFLWLISFILLFKRKRFNKIS